MRHFLVACCLLLSFAARADIVDIDNAELARLTASGVPLIDIRTAQEWQETGIVPGSRLITFFDEQGKADPAAWLEKAKIVVKPGEPVAVICRSGNRTKAVSRFLSEQAGYAKVYNVKDGIRGWTREGRPVTPAAPVLAAFTGTAAARSPTEADVPAGGQEKAAVGAAVASQDSERLEKALQGLPWDQFKTVVTAIPKLKADVDAYGPLGWQYVQANYKTYPWRKSINKLHDPQKKRLSEMIDEVRAGTKPAPQQP